jgi:trk system potassium uptake protein TrkA
MAKTSPPGLVLDKPLKDTGIRRDHGVTVVGVKKRGGSFGHATGDTVVEAGDTLIVSGVPGAVERFSALR